MNEEITELIDAIAEAYEITSDDLCNGSRVSPIIGARKALMLSLIALDYDYRDFGEIIPQSRTMPLHYRENSIDLFRLDMTFRLVIKQIFKKIGQNDKFEQFASRYPYKAIDRDAKAVEEDASISIDNQASEPNTEGKLFYFTAEEEEAIARARREIPIWFERKYGRLAKGKYRD